jgi:hypothetical protein
VNSQIRQHGVITQKTINCIYTAVKAPNLKTAALIFNPGMFTCIPEYYLLNNAFNSLDFPSCIRAMYCKNSHGDILTSHMEIGK